jgi:hypothetical protein
MAHLIDRRRWLTGLALIAASPARAEATPGLDGTWGGAQGDLTAQVIVVGSSVIGFYWRDDYLEVSNAALAPDGRTLSFAFKGGAATLTRTGERTARLDVTQGAHTLHLDLQRD